ncbi:hypothetical protein OG933_02115 [Streptomyces sp. NBC_00016]|uniref:hypothetical protein n=1 Tax=Streptomyces sp. NBC_00016 TaxID=2975622 RepID=UPI003253378B
MPVPPDGSPLGSPEGIPEGALPVPPPREPISSGLAHAGGRGDAYDPGARTTVQEDVLVSAHQPVRPAGVERGDGGRTITMALAGLVGSPSPAGPAGPDKASAQEVPDSGGGTMLSALRSPQSPPWALLALLGTCALLGALHALTPGHGKALLATYLVGADSTSRQAVVLGAVITFTHTASVIALGTAVLFAGHFVVPGYWCRRWKSPPGP